MPIGIVHPFGAWDEGDDVVFWSPAFRVFRSGSTFELEPAPFQEPSRNRLMEFRMNIKDPARAIKITEIKGDYETIEFSRINPLFFGYPARYGYGGWQDFHGPTRGPMGGIGFNFRGLTKIDFQEKRIARQLTLPEGCVGGDPSYVPRPGSELEDDGWLCVMVYDTLKNATFLHLYNADNLELAVALSFPVRVPPGFHSSYVPEPQFEEHLRKHGVASKL